MKKKQIKNIPSVISTLTSLYPSFQGARRLLRRLHQHHLRFNTFHSIRTNSFPSMDITLIPEEH